VEAWRRWKLRENDGHVHPHAYADRHAIVSAKAEVAASIARRQDRIVYGGLTACATLSILVLSVLLFRGTGR
jgi:hypothetical protein